MSGTAAGVNYAASILSSNGLVGRGLPLPVSAPFHCSLMAPAAQALGNELSKYDFIMPSIEVLSNVNAKPVKVVNSMCQRKKYQNY